MHLSFRLAVGFCVLAILAFSQVVEAKKTNQDLMDSPISNWGESQNGNQVFPSNGVNINNLKTPNLASSSKVGIPNTIKAPQSQSVIESGVNINNLKAPDLASSSK